MGSERDEKGRNPVSLGLDPVAAEDEDAQEDRFEEEGEGCRGASGLVRARENMDQGEGAVNAAAALPSAW